MDEYIEREAAVQAMKDLLDRPGISEGVSLGVQLRILALPAADVAPVRHGRWVKYAGKLVCSECKKYPPMKDESGGWRTYHEWPYCPNCGAKMDGEEETKDEQRP